MKGLLLIFLIASCVGFNKEQNFVDIVVAVKHYFRSGCVYFLYDEEHGLYQHRKLNTISNCFSNKGVSVGVILISAALQFSETLQCKYNRPVFIIPQHEMRIRYLFQKLAEEIQLSSIIWLLFLDTYSILEKFFVDINIPFDCEFLVVLRQNGRIVLTEVYRVSQTHPLQTYHFGNWTASKGLIGPTQDFYKRRNDLQGLVFKTGTINGDMIKVTKEENNKPIGIGGSFGDIWHALERALNFSSDYYTPEDNWYGSYSDSGNWNGLVGMIMRDEVHVTNVDMTWTTDRGDVVDFITQIHQVRRYVFSGLSDSAELVWQSLLMPFSPALWTALLLSLLALSALLWLAAKLRHCYGSELNGKEPNFSFLQSVFCAFSAFCSQGHKGTPSLLSSRLIFLTTHLTAVTILTSYSASLICSIMTQVFELPFNSFEELLQAGNYRLAAEPYSSQIMFFKMSHNSLLRAVYDKCIKPIEHSIPPTLLERMRMVCADRKYSTIATETDVFTRSSKLNCILQKVPNAYIKGVVAFAIQKKSPYRTIFKRTVHALLRIGLIKIDENKMKKVEPDISSVSLSQATPIIVVLASGIAVATFITVVERLLFWKALHCKFQGIKSKIYRKNIKHFISELRFLRIFKRDQSVK